MYRCKGITKKGLQCKRNISKSDYCRQHKFQKNMPKFLTLSSVIISNIIIYIDPKTKKELTNSCKYFYNILKNNKYINFNLYPYYNNNVIDYIKNNNLSFSIKQVEGDGNCSIYTIHEFLKDKIKNINIKKIQKIIKKHIDYQYENQKWLEILDIVKILDYFGFGVIFKIIVLDNFIYLGYNIKEEYKNVCFINYIEELHFDLLMPEKINN